MILAVDIGTSVLKAGLFSPEGELTLRSEVPVYLLDQEDPLSHEADAASWISSLALVAAQLEIKRHHLQAVVVSGNGPTMVPVGADGKPLDFAMTWMDRRGVEEAQEISQVIGAFIDPTFYLPKAYWIYHHKADLYQRVRHFLPCPEYVNFYLTETARAILPAEGFERYIWTPEYVQALGMDPEKFPGFIRPGETVGRVVPKAEEEVGIPAGTPVIAAGPDFTMTLLGTATVRPGRVCERSGTSEGINLCSDRVVEDKRLLSLPHIIRPYINISGIISTSGKATEWFKNISGKGDLDYETLFEDICQVPSGARGLIFLPYLTGERAPIWDTDARGCFIGLSMQHGRKEMTRAVVESVGFAVRDVIEVMEEQGLTIEDLRLTGGQARSPLWNQIKADITGKKILVTTEKDAELIGAACVGLYALGRYQSLSEAAEHIVSVQRTFTPRQQVKELYDTLFGLYRRSYKGLKDVFQQLAAIKYTEDI